MYTELMIEKVMEINEVPDLYWKARLACRDGAGKYFHVWIYGRPAGITSAADLVGAKIVADYVVHSYEALNPIIKR